MSLLPAPRTVLAGPPRPLRRRPNRATGASERLAAAVGRLPPMGLTVRFDVASSPKPVPALGDVAAYRLRLEDAVALVDAKTEWGALAALATLAQLGGGDRLAVAEVRDAPRFPWRGLMIDTARHFMSLATLRRALDAMWFYKLNVLHLHLTDDQGFRFRSAAYPELASADAYGADELRALVAYAADRGVRVVPELDMPGHATSWLAARPEWAFGDTAPAGPSARFGIHRACLDPRNANAQAAVSALLAELAAIFPDEFCHIGGDEVAGMPDEQQALFNGGAVRRLAALGKRAVGWDECLRADLPAETVVQVWRGMRGRDVALNAGHDVVVSAPYYLDLFYPADVHYAFHPAGDYRAAEAARAADPRLAHVSEGLRWMNEFANFPKLPSRPAGRVLGGEACLWSELVTDELLDARVWSRMPAIAERFWSGQARDDVLERLALTRRQLAALGVVPEDRAAMDAHADLAPLIEMLEPVKWYRRLLGDAGYRQRMNGMGGAVAPRPYDARTPLNRIVDRIAPESLASRRAEADLAAGAPMQGWIDGWRRQRVALDANPALQAELGAASDALAELAERVADGRREDAAALAGPFGEYLLPIAYAVADAPARS